MKGNHKQGAAMKNVFGNHLTLTLFGESHGPAVGAVIDGLPAGIQVSEDEIRSMMDRRKAYGRISTARREEDKVEFLSGIRDGYTQGTPVAILIRNENAERKDYKENIIRPSHADYTGLVKYQGYADLSGGGHFSGRLTAPLTAAGAICIGMLAKKGITIGTHILQIGTIQDEHFHETDPADQLDVLKGKQFPVICDQAAEMMKQAITAAADEGDSLGGILETAVCGLEAGIGEPWFDTAEGMIAHAVFSVPAVKGISFGAGFDLAQMKGSEANDAFTAENGKIRTITNHSGGISGGITTGMPVLFRTVIKPTPSIAKEQRSVDPETLEEKIIAVKGRHDPAIVHRACPVIDAVTAFVIADLCMERYGTLWFTEKNKDEAER